LAGTNGRSAANTGRMAAKTERYQRLREAHKTMSPAPRAARLTAGMGRVKLRIQLQGD
jgi:hypothetical protein